LLTSWLISRRYRAGTQPFGSEVGTRSNGSGGLAGEPDRHQQPVPVTGLQVTAQKLVHPVHAWPGDIGHQAGRRAEPEVDEPGRHLTFSVAHRKIVAIDVLDDPERLAGIDMTVLDRAASVRKPGVGKVLTKKATTRHSWARRRYRRRVADRRIDVTQTTPIPNPNEVNPDLTEPVNPDPATEPGMTDEPDVDEPEDPTGAQPGHHGARAASDGDRN
jgi:hypothetical protein